MSKRQDHAPGLSAHDAQRRVYLDYNATTPVHPRVAAAMQSALDSYGNPSSAHWAGASARQIIEDSRRQIAHMLGCEPDEVIFTSGGTEANNLALKGLIFARGATTSHIITSAIEHPAIDAPCAFLQRLGASRTVIPVDGTGLVDPDDIRRAIRPATTLISIMHANNEVGTIQPIAQCARIAREHGIAFHSDAAQSVGKIPTQVATLGVDMLSLAGHKFYAPKGVGALYVRRGLTLEPLMHGAQHERGRRAGTESATLCAALGAASALAMDLASNETLRELRDTLWSGLRESFGARVVLNGHPLERLPNTLNVSFLGAVGSELLARVPDIAASTGSACHSGSIELSPVLHAMGITPEIGVGAVRFSLGRETTRAHIESALAQLNSLSLA
jgi:cysteine desulfurase